MVPALRYWAAVPSRRAAATSSFRKLSSALSKRVLGDSRDLLLFSAEKYISLLVLRNKPSLMSSQPTALRWILMGINRTLGAFCIPRKSLHYNDHSDSPMT